MGKVLVVAGIPGTCKTTVCKETLKLAENSGKRFKVINYGSPMVSLTQKRGRTLHREDLRKLKPSLQRNLQAEEAKATSQQVAEAEGDVNIDTHMSIKTVDGYLAGLPFDVLQILNPNAFVLIEAEPNEVLLRRLKGVKRRRDEDMESEIMEELFFSRLMTASHSILTGEPMKTVKNPNGKQVEVTMETLTLLE